MIVPSTSKTFDPSAPIPISDVRGKPLFALVPIEDAEYMELLEDKSDIEAIETDKAEGGPSAPWEDVKKELGL